MRKIISIAFLTFAMFGCKDNEKKADTKPMTEVKTEADDIDAPILEKACYAYIKDGNLARFEVTQIDGSSVKGQLTYAYAEKDKNDGTFEGILTGDTLLGTYTFMSEGVMSVREIAFKVEDNQLLEGYGDMDENGTRFKDTSTLNYPNTMPLKKGECGGK